MASIFYKNDKKIDFYYQINNKLRFRTIEIFSAYKTQYTNDNHTFTRAQKKKKQRKQ